MRLRKITGVELKDQYSIMATCFVPESDSIEEYKKIKKGDVVEVKLKDKSRNYEHHKKLFAILNYVVDNSDFEGKEDDLLTVLKYEIGYTRECKNLSGSTRVFCKSINFETLGQYAFEEFYKKVMFVLSKYMNDSIENIEAHSLEYKSIKGV
jgi:hypothetical protein